MDNSQYNICVSITFIVLLSFCEEFRIQVQTLYLNLLATNSKFSIIPTSIISISLQAILHTFNPIRKFQFQFFRLLWPCIMNVGWRERETNKMQLIWCLSNFYLHMFRASLCPSSGEQECVLPHVVFCTVTRGEQNCELWQP